MLVCPNLPLDLSQTMKQIPMGKLPKRDLELEYNPDQWPESQQIVKVKVHMKSSQVYNFYS